MMIKNIKPIQQPIQTGSYDVINLTVTLPVQSVQTTRDKTTDIASHPTFP